MTVLVLRAAGMAAAVQLRLAMLALLVMGSVTVVDVALKYLFRRPITGAYDLVESLLPVVVFYGLPSALLRRQNIIIDLIDRAAGAQGTRALVRCADAVMLAALGLVLWAMTGPAVMAYEYGDRKLELGLPMAVIWAVVIVGMAGNVLAALAVLLAPPTPRHA